jgi:hypothetical protein
MPVADRSFGGELVIDLLQQSSMPDVSGILLTVGILWGIWPVACGVIGAMRGQTVQGVVHGFLWGPIGVLVVLLSSRKYECPTCGKKTLRQPHNEICPTNSLFPPPAMPGMARKALNLGSAVAIREDPPRMARPTLHAAPHVPEPAASSRSEPLLSPDTNIPIPSPAADGVDVGEVEKLRAWVNAD